MKFPIEKIKSNNSLFCKMVASCHHLLSAVLTVIAVLFCTIVLMTACLDNSADKKTTTTDIDNQKEVVNDGREEIEFDFINVGKGDCNLVRVNEYVYLIDTGYKSTAEEVITYLNNKDIKVIDGLILTHFDKDHIGGAAKIVRNFEVKAVYQPDYKEDSDEYKLYEKAVKKRNIENRIVTLQKDIEIKTDGVTIKIFAPLQKNYDEVNDYSLVTKIEYKNENYLLAGDAEQVRIDELIDNYREEIADCTLLKIPHHGFGEINSEEFIDINKPEIAVFTCGDKNSIDENIIEELEKLKARLFFTSDKTITFRSDGMGKWQFK